MAREFARKFYRSKEWRHIREYIYTRDNGLCRDCIDNNMITPGKEVHHIKPINEKNIDDPDITLNENNLILLCKDCHAKRHKGHRRYIYNKDKPKASSIRKGLTFNANGEVVEAVEKAKE